MATIRTCACGGPAVHGAWCAQCGPARPVDELGIIPWDCEDIDDVEEAPAP